METVSSRVTSKGQVVIPKKLREKYGIRTATAIRWIEKDQGILKAPESEDPIVAARGMLKGSGILKAYINSLTTFGISQRLNRFPRGCSARNLP